jgi:diketogulonate reductase-like aldo/keto reductase
MSDPADPLMVTLPGSELLPPMGLGTWRMGELAARRATEVAAVRTAIEIGYRIVDTAEMYGDGGAEKIVGTAVADALRHGAVDRDRLFIVSKVYPQNATAAGIAVACERSLKRLSLDRLDLYLLHWRGAVPLADTVAGFEGLQARGLIRHWGVSNFDVDDMRELVGVAGGERCAVNQIYYSLTQRGPAFELLPWQAGHGIATMAYSPIDQGTLSRSAPLRAIAERRGVTPAQLALAWLVGQPGVIAIPKAVSELHLRENIEALALILSGDDHRALDAAFSPPRKKSPLAML